MMSLAGYKRRYVEEDDQALGDQRDVDHLYYNATIVSDSTNRFAKSTASAQFNERRIVPLLTDTTGWRVAVTHLTAQNVTSKLPIFEPTFLNPTSYDTIYNVGVQVDFTTFPTGSTPSPNGLVTLPTATRYYTNGYSPSGGVPMTATISGALPIDSTRPNAPYCMPLASVTATPLAYLQIPIDYVPGSAATIQWIIVPVPGSTVIMGEWVVCLARSLADGSLQPISQQVIDSASAVTCLNVPYNDSQAVFVPGEAVNFYVFPAASQELPLGGPTSQSITGGIVVALNTFQYQNSTRYSYRGSAPVVAVPQHPTHPSWCTSYNHWARNVTRALQTASASVDAQLSQSPYSKVVTTDYIFYLGSGNSYAAGVVVPSNTIPPIGSLCTYSQQPFPNNTYVTGIVPGTGFILNNDIPTVDDTSVTFTAYGTITTLTITAGGAVTGGLSYTLPAPLPTLSTPTNFGIYSQFVGGTALSSAGVNACYVSTFTPTKVTLANTGSALTATTGTLQLLSTTGSVASVTLPAGAITANTAVYPTGAPTNTICLGAIIVSGAGAANGTSVIGIGTNPYSLKFSSGFTATASTYTFLNVVPTSAFLNTGYYQYGAYVPRLAYPSPTVSFSPSSGLFSMHAHPNSIIGRALVPSQESDGNAPSSVPSQNYAYKYRLNNGPALDVSYAVLNGPIVFPTTSGTPMSYLETWTITFNEALQAVMPFPLVKSLDYDASLSDASSNEISFHGASLVANDDPFSLESASSGKQYVLSLPQEFVCTGSWNPFVGLTITSNSIPVQMEGLGLTRVFAGSTPPSQSGGAAHAVLFDYNFDVTDAHSIVQGIDYNPQILRWTNLTGGPLADISFNIYLKRRDGTLVPLDIPSDASIDLKLLFSKQ